jgi:hypothetical protein
MTSDSRWKLLLVIAGTVLLACLVIWVISSLVWPSPFPEAREPGGPGIRGTRPDMPVQAMEAAMAKAKEAMQGRYRAAHGYHWGNRVCDWIGFGLTSIITIVIGATGRVLRPGEDPLEVAKQEAASGTLQQERQRMRVVGVVAALATVMIGVSSRLQSESQRALEQGEKVQEVMATARKDFNDAANPAEAEKVIDNLEAEIAKI